MLHQFVTLADELHFGRAADRLTIARSVLSVQMQRLEDILGAQLLERNRRAAVRLTRAGEVFLAEARDAIDRLDRAQEIGRAAGRWEAGPITIGYVLSAAMNGMLTRCLRILREDRPLLEANVKPMETPDQIVAVRDGVVDVGLVRPRSTYPAGIAAHIVHREDLVLVHAAHHPLASAQTISTKMLRDDTFIVPQLDERSGLGHALDQLHSLAGMSRPPIATGDFVSAMIMAASGRGLVLAPRSLSRLNIDGACCRDIDDYKGTIDLALIYRNDGFAAVGVLLTNRLEYP